MKKAVKRLTYSALFYSGLHKTRPKSNSRLILMYHGVTAKDHTRQFGRHLPAKQFEKHLLYLKKHFLVLALDEIITHQPDPKHPAIALTFDDGFENNLSHALPLLEKHKVPATFFITTFSFGRNELLPSDLIDAVRAASKIKELQFAGDSYIKKGPHRLLRKNDGQNIYETLVKLKPADLNKAIGEFADRYSADALIEKTDPECCQLMSEEQVKKLAASPYVTIGSHSRSHYALTTCTGELLAEELVSSKKELERITGKTISSLAFPYGDHDERVIEQCKKAGCTTLLAAGTSSFPDVLPRAGIISAGSFEQNMVNVWRGFERFGF